MAEMAIPQMMHTNELKIEDILITQQHLDYHILIVTNKAFITDGYPGHVIGFTALIYMNILIMSFIPPKLLLATLKHHYMQEA